MKNKYPLAILALTTALVKPHGAYADMVDYGSLESLFGEPVTTSATGTPQRASNVAADMTIITADDIRRSGTRNIPQIIGQYVPGIDIFQAGLNAFDVGVRGYQQSYQPRLLVLLDGRQVFVDDYSRTIWDNLPVNIDDIRQIEVVKGAASALFGSNAAGGVVNIITTSPVYDHNKVASLRIGTQNEVDGDATVSTKISDGSGIKFSAGGLSAHEFNTESRNSTDPHIWDPMHQYFLESSVFQLAQGLQATTELSYSISHDNPQQPALTGRNAEATKSYSARAGLQWQGDYGLITNNTYFYHTAVDASVSGILYPDATSLFVSQLQDQFKIGAAHTIRTAVEYRYKDFSYNYPQSLTQMPEFQEQVIAPSVTWLWQMDSKWSWTNAIRLDHQSERQTGTLFANAYYNNSQYSHDINSLSANSGLVYKATDLDTFRATYGRGVQLPSFIEGGDNVVIQTAAHTYLDLEGNPYLKPTVVENYALTYERQLPSIYSIAKISPFYEINHDVIAFAVDQSISRTIGLDTYILDQSKNEGSSRGLGGEIELKGHHPSGYRWDTSYSYSRVDDGIGVARTIGYDGSTPAHHFNLSGGYTSGPWEFDAFSSAVTSAHMQSAVGVKTQTNGYVSLSSRIGYKLNEQFTLALSGTNLTQVQTKESPFPAVVRQVFLTLTGHF